MSVGRPHPIHGSACVPRCVPPPLCPPRRPRLSRAADRYITLPIGEGDSVALAPRILFAHLPYQEISAITHLTAARGFSAKVSTLRRIGKWYPQGSQVRLPSSRLPSVPLLGRISPEAAARGAGICPALRLQPSLQLSLHFHVRLRR